MIACPPPTQRHSKQVFLSSIIKPPSQLQLSSLKSKAMHSPLPTIKNFLRAAKNMVKRKGKSKASTRARTDLAITSVPIPIQKGGAPTSPSLSMGSMVTCAKGSWYSAPSDTYEIVVGSQDAFPSEEAPWGEQYGEYHEYEEYEEDEEDEEREEKEHEYFWEELWEHFHAEGDVKNELDAVTAALRIDGLMLAGCTSIGTNDSGMDLFNRDRFKSLPSFPLSELDEEEMETTQWNVDVLLEEPQEQEVERTSMSLMQTISNTWTEVKMTLRSKISIRSLQSKAT
ncbi:1d2c455f-af94-40df-b077-b5010c9cbadd [Sclerotinia trifoliorum]|uniref:1d2c455f-af94-40df-b077-b5010c9cbadd n=1 Tax=Sclerotinia trifoliorum TaxID=28548 RepID=A0A8H2ZWA5_9HELO|nr:1d2c455f-af94-40df-b077-b5010c9cbadd [Sclerotinia trifoliorum]